MVLVIIVDIVPVKLGYQKTVRKNIIVSLLLDDNFSYTTLVPRLKLTVVTPDSIDRTRMPKGE